MKKQFLYLSTAVLILALMTGISSCKKDSSPASPKLTSLVAGTIDLNGLYSSNVVPANPTIVAIFPADIDPATVTADNVKLIRDYDTATIALTLTPSGKNITILPSENLASGAMHRIVFGSGLKFTDGKTLSADIVRTFTTEGFFAPSGMTAYWNFNADANDLVGTHNPSAEIDMTYTPSRKATAGNAATFNGTTSIIEIPDADTLMHTNSFTLSFWLKATEAGHGHFVIGMGAYYGFQFELDAAFKWFKMPAQYQYANGSTGTGGDPTYNGDGKTYLNGGYMGTVFNKADANIDAQLKDKWAHIVFVYNSVTKQRMFFLNGELVFKQDHNLWPVGDIQRTVVGLKFHGPEPDVYNDLALGFIQSRRGTMWATETWGGYNFPTANHFKGQLDDIRIFSKAVSEAEVRLIYNSEK
jgi:hypothetical protein